MTKTIKKEDSEATKKLLSLMDQNELVITDDIQKTLDDGRTITTGNVSFLNKSGLAATFIEYGRDYIALQINAGSSSISLADISGLLSLNPSYNTLYQQLRFSTVSVYAGAASGTNSNECLTIEGTATSDTSLEANFLGIDDLPLTELTLSVGIKHKEDGLKKDIGVIVIAKLTIEGKEVQVVLSLPIADQGLWKLRLIAPGLDFSLAKLTKLIMGSKVFEELPAQVKSIPSLNITRLEISFDPNQKRLNDISFALQSVSEWDLVPGSGQSSVLALKDIGLDINIYRDSTGSFTYYGHINATAHISSFDITACIPLPVTGILSLYTNTTKPLDDLGVFSELLTGTGFSSFLASGDFKENFSMSVHNLGVELNLSNRSSNKSLLTYFVLDGEGSVDLTIANFSLNLTLNLLIERVAEAEKLQYIIDAQASLLINKISLTLIGKYNSDAKGWLLKGNITPDRSITIDEIVIDLVTKFGINSSIPSSISGFKVNHLATSFNTKTKDFTFTCESKFSIDNQELDITVNINIIQQLDGAYKKHFDGHITLGSLNFALIFDTDKNSTSFLAAYHDEQTIKIKNLIGYIDDKLKEDIPEGLEISLKDALFAYSKQGTVTNFLFGLNMGGGINLSNLPLVGREFTPNQTIKISLQILVTKADFKKEELQTFNTLYIEGGIQLPTTDINKRLDLIPSIQLGSEIQQLELPIIIDKKTGQIEETTPAPNNNLPPSVVTPSSSSTQISDSTKYFTLQKSFGSVHFQRIGLKYQDSKIWVLLDASLSLAGLSLSLDGLAVNSPLSKFDPHFDLKGIGIDYKGGESLEIGGAFLRTTRNGIEQYDGAAIIKFNVKGKALTLSAIGSYAYFEGHPSLFIYALLNYPLGGPSFFFVTGLAAGFGYNRALKVPTIDQVATFPLVAEAVNPPPTSGSNLDQATRLTEELTKLQNYIPQETGQIFLAIGVKFTSFKIIDAFVLLTVAFGHRFELNILGLATLIAPPDVGAGVPPVAQVQLALKASFLPAEGFLGIIAQLTPNSYILSQACHLTGGFAFYSWFAPSEHEGDFVLTLGGYHPLFKVPSHYPKVPRLGLNWQVSPELYIKADAYFALTASALMVGGNLQATWNSGPLSAWFNAKADFIIAWKPYYYDISIYVDMGVSYTYHVFGTHHITVELGADLHIWGPEFTGIAHIHLWIVSFDVRFGNSAAQAPTPIDWQTFKSSFLPADSDICSIAVKEGLVRKVNQDDKSDLGIINPKDFCLFTNSVIPAKKAVYPPSESSPTLDIETDGANLKFGIASMAVTSQDLTSSKLIITINRDGKPLTSEQFQKEFACTSILKKVPTGLWGESLTPDLNGNQFVENTLAGFEIKPKKQPDSGATHAIDCSQLQGIPDLINNAYQWEPIKTFDEDEEKDKKKKIQNTILDNSVKTARENLFKALSLDIETINISENIADEFLVLPKVGSLV